MSRNSSWILEPAGRLTVYGVTLTCQPYAVEITDPKRAMDWAKVLCACYYQRLTMGPYPRKYRKVKP